MSESTWLRVAFDGALSHCVHESLFAPLVIDMAKREHPIKNFERDYGKEQAASLGGNPARTVEWAIDFGGSCYVHMPKETFSVDGLSLDIWCDHMSDATRALRESEVRTFASGERYHKIRHWHHATVLTVGQHAALLHDVGRRLPEAERRASDFMATIRQKMRDLDQAAIVRAYRPRR